MLLEFWTAANKKINFIQRYHFGDLKVLVILNKDKESRNRIKQKYDKWELTKCYLYNDFKY